MIIDKNFTWHHQINNVAPKLNRDDAMLSKIRDFVNFNTLKSTYHAIFESHLYCSLPAWAQKLIELKDLVTLKDHSHNNITHLKFKNWWNCGIAFT